MNEQAYFDELITAATAELTGDEVLLANVAGEQTDFIRFNQGDVRQAGTINQRKVSVDLIEGLRHTAGSIRLTGDRAMDEARLSALLAQLRETHLHPIIGSGRDGSTDDVGRDRQLSMAPSTLQAFIAEIRESFEQHAMAGESPALLSSPGIRPYVRSIVERFRPATVIMSQNEIHPKVKIKTLGQI